MARTGRPTKLTPNRLKKAKAYYNAKKSDNKMPLIEELSVYFLDVDRHTVARWVTRGDNQEWLGQQTPAKAKLFKDFCSTIKKLADLQLMHLKVRGLADRGNSVAIFLMKADHGLIETQRHVVAGDRDEPIRIDIFGKQKSKVVEDE